MRDRVGVYNQTPRLPPSPEDTRRRARTAACSATRHATNRYDNHDHMWFLQQYGHLSVTPGSPRREPYNRIGQLLVTVNRGYLPCCVSAGGCRREGDSRRISVSDSFNRALKLEGARRLGSSVRVTPSPEASVAMIKKRYPTSLSAERYHTCD